jgi:hypothetical protein
MAYLNKHRDGKGKWKGFPYYYTLYVLSEMDSTLFINKMQYAAKLIEKRLSKRKSAQSKYELRRNYISEKILNKVDSTCFLNKQAKI